MAKTRAARLESRVRREQLANAVLSVVAARGLRGLSVAAVARRVGLVPSAIYRHFRNKDEMLDAALASIGSRLLSNVDAACRDGGDSAPDRLRLLLARHVAMIRGNRGIPRVVFSEDVYGGRPARRASVYRSIRAYLGRVAAIVRDGQEEGRFRRDVDPDTVAVVFLGLVQPSAILYHMSGRKFDVTRQAKRAWRVFHEAIRGRDGAPRRRKGTSRTRSGRKGAVR